jgi:hypothetical protein
MSGRAEEHRRAQKRVLIGFGVVAVLAAGGFGAVNCSGDAMAAPVARDASRPGHE